MLSWPVHWNQGVCGGLLLGGGVMKTLQDSVHSYYDQDQPC